MAPRRASTSSETSEQLPDLPTSSNRRRLPEQERQLKAVLSPARTASAAQSPKSSRKQRETPDTKTKIDNRSVTRSVKKRRINDVDTEEEEVADPVPTVRSGLSKRKRKKPVIELPEEEEEEPTKERNDPATKTSAFDKSATSKVFPHQTAAPAPLSACSAASVATLTDSVPAPSILDIPGPSASASTSKRAVTPDPLSTLASTATAQRSSQRAFADNRNINVEDKATLLFEPASSRVQSDVSSLETGRATFLNMKDSSGTIPDTSTEPPTPPPPIENDVHTTQDHHASHSRPSSSASTNDDESEFSCRADNADSLARKERCQNLLSQQKKHKGKQRQVESDDEVDDTDIEEDGKDESKQAKSKPASKSIKQDKQVKEDTEMQSETEDEEAEDVNHPQAPPSAQQRPASLTGAEEDEHPATLKPQPIKGKAREHPGRGKARDRDSGYVTSPLESAKPEKVLHVVSSEESDSSLEVGGLRKPRSTCSLAPTQTRTTRSTATRGGQAKILRERAKAVEEQLDDTTEEEQEEVDNRKDEQEAKEAKEPTNRGSLRRSVKLSATEEEQEDDQASDNKEVAVQENMPTRASQRKRAPANYAPQVTRHGNLRRQNTSDPNISTKPSKPKANPVKPGPSSTIDKGKNKEKSNDVKKAKDYKRDWDKESEKSSQSTSRATRSSLRPATPVKPGATFTSLSDLLEAAKKALQHDMYELSMSVQYEGRISKVPLIDIECANYRGVGPDNRALGCNARITASAKSVDNTKASHSKDIAWVILHAQDNHCTSCQDYNRDGKTTEVSEAEKAAFERAQDILSDGPTFRKFITGKFTEEDILKIEDASKATEGSSPAPSPGPSVSASRKKNEQKTKPTGKPASKREREGADSDSEGARKRQKKDEERDESDADEITDPAVMPEKAKQIVPVNKGRRPVKTTYAGRRGNKAAPKSKAIVSDSEGSSIHEIAVHSNAGFALEKAGASLSKNQKEQDRPPKSTNPNRKEAEPESQVEIYQAAATERDESVEPSLDFPIPPPALHRDKAASGAARPSHNPSLKSDSRPSIAASKPRSVAIPSKSAPEEKVDSPKPDGRDPTAEASSSSTVKGKTDAVASDVRAKRPPSSQAMARRTGAKARPVEPSSDVEEAVDDAAELGKPASKRAEADDEREDDEGSEESSQEEASRKKTVVLDKMMKGKGPVRPARSANSEASSSSIVKKPASAEVVAERAAAPVIETNEKGPVKSIGLNTQLSNLDLPPEMLDALALSSGLETLDDILSAIRIRATTVRGLQEGAAALSMHGELMKIVTIARASMLSGDLALTDEEAQAICKRENQQRNVARAAFLLSRAICNLPSEVRAIDAGI